MFLPAADWGGWKLLVALVAAGGSLAVTVVSRYLSRKKKPDAAAEFDESRARATQLLAEAQSTVSDSAVSYVKVLMDRVATLEKTQLENVQHISDLATQATKCLDDKEALQRLLDESRAQFEQLDRRLRTLEQAAAPGGEG